MMELFGQSAPDGQDGYVPGAWDEVRGVFLDGLISDRAYEALYRALKQKAPTFRRLVEFEKGYNYLHETGPRRRGQHGMGIRFLLIGPHGAAQFLTNTSWTPLGEVDEDKNHDNGYHREPVHIDKWESTEIGGLSSVKFGYVRPPSGYDLGYHWRTPQYEGHEEYKRAGCKYLNGDPCYYDGSGLAGDDVLRDMVTKGEKWVWKWLVRRYRSCLEAEVDSGSV